jgi:ribonuclease HI
MTEPASVEINIDGAARGNPGPAALAYIIRRGNQPVIEHAECLGEATNNVAEYSALVRALERAAELGAQRLLIRSDSELLVKQMNGQYRVKNRELQKLHDQACQLRRQFESVSIQYVPRAANSQADRLCNEALDARPAGSKARSSRPRPAKQADKKTLLQEFVHREAVQCLRQAASAWSQSVSAAPSAEQVWDQLWSILEENGLV